MNLRDHLFDQPRLLEATRGGTEVEPVPLVPDVVDEEVVWAAPRAACMQECPSTSSTSTRSWTCDGTS